jgi:dUTP pyrophosphatase
MVSTGIAIALPQGYEAQIRARSGVASKGIIVLNAPGTVDEDFRGEIKVLLANLGLNDSKNNPSSPYKIKKGDRIAQMVVARVTKAHLRVVEELDETERGEGGFGSTGISN